MAKLSINLDERGLKNGMAQLRLRIAHRNTNAYIPTGIYIEPQYFIPGSLYDPIHRKAYMAVDKRDRLNEIIRQADEWLNEATQLSRMTAKEIREAIYGENNKEQAPARQRACTNRRNSAHDFIVHFERYGSARSNDKTRKSYEYAWNVLREYCQSLSLQALYFDDINYQRLSDLARWLRATGRGESTRHMIECYVRAAYKEGQRLHIVDRKDDPYFDYSIAPVPQRDIEALTAEQIRALMELDLSKTAGLARARDCALMSFYLCGANLLDIYGLEELQGGEVVFVRHKVQRATMRATRIRVEPELQALLDRYQGEAQLLRFAECSPNYETFQSKINKQLCEVSKKVGFKVTMALVRRSWSTIAGSLDISDRVINKSMGHMDQSVNDRHYEQYDWSRTARANRAVIDAVRGLS